MMARNRLLVTSALAALSIGLWTPAALAQEQPRPRPVKPVPPQPGIAAAVPLPPRFAIAVSGGYQPSTTTFDDSFSFRLHQETGTTRTSYTVGGGPMFDAGVGVRLWNRLGAGVAVSRLQVDGSTSVSTAVPHPFFLDRHRTVEGEAGGMRRTETALHLEAQYSIPLRGRLQVTVMGGPSLVQADQTLVSDVNFTDEYPYDTATFTGVDSATTSGSAAGFHAGVDVRYLFNRTVGAGALVRFSRAALQLEAGDRTVSFDAGGAQVGVGIRVLFDRRTAPARPRRTGRGAFEPADR